MLTVILFSDCRVWSWSRRLQAQDLLRRHRSWSRRIRQKQSVWFQWPGAILSILNSYIWNEIRVWKLWRISNFKEIFIVFIFYFFNCFRALVNTVWRIWEELSSVWSRTTAVGTGLRLWYKFQHSIIRNNCILCADWPTPSITPKRSAEQGRWVKSRLMRLLEPVSIRAHRI